MGRAWLQHECLIENGGSIGGVLMGALCMVCDTQRLPHVRTRDMLSCSPVMLLVLRVCQVRHTPDASRR